MRVAVRAGAEASGRDPGQVTCAANLTVAFTPDRTAASQDGQLRVGKLRGDSTTIASWPYR
jgi:hypothetical protein